MARPEGYHCQSLGDYISARFESEWALAGVLFCVLKGVADMGFVLFLPHGVEEVPPGLGSRKKCGAT